MSGVNKRKSVGATTTKSDSAAVAVETEQPKKKVKTTKQSKAKEVDHEEEKEEEQEEEQADDATLLGDLEARILGDESEDASIAQHFNSLVKIIQIAEKLRGSSIKDRSTDEVAVGISAVQAGVRIFTEWFATNQFTLSKTAAKKKEKNAALQALQGLLAAQYKKLWSLLLLLVQCDVEVVQSNALNAAMDLVQAEGCAAAAASSEPSAVTESLSNGSFHSLLRTIMLAGSVTLATQTEFAQTFIDQHADLRHNVYLQLKSMAHLASADWQSLNKEFGGSSPSPGVQHVVEYLLKSDWKSSLTKNWIVLPATNPDEADLMALPTLTTSASSDTLKKLYGEIWMGILKHKMKVETYKDILVQLHSSIIPALPQPLLLADFLTDSYNIGGIVSLLALNGLFILISKFNLDYPSFFKKLYTCCKPYVFHAKYRARFFQLVSLFLTSSYLPSYLVCAFTKRFARLSLTAPPSGAIFCIAVIYNLLRRHPVCRPLINRTIKTQPNADQAQPVKKGESKAVTEHIAGPMTQVGGGILSSLANLLKARQDAVASGTLADPLNDPEENTSLRLTLPVYQAPPPSQNLYLGNDPYRYEEEDPELSFAQDSSLWEIKSLTEHFSPTVSNLAKVFFTTHAPKKDLEMNKYIEQSYDTLFTKETERRVNQKVALQQHYKFSGLFADATQTIGLTFQLPAGTAVAQISERAHEQQQMDETE